MKVIVLLRTLTPIFGRRKSLNETIILRLVTKFETAFSLHKIIIETRERISRNVESIAAVQQSVSNDPNVSIPHRSQQLRMSPTTVW